MQQIAREVNLPETAFLTPSGEKYLIRWFTPRCEVDLCGHATLAAAHVLWESGFREPELPLRFWTKNGTLTAKRAGRIIWLDFPALPCTEVPPPEGLFEALGIAGPSFVGKNRFDYLIEVLSESLLKDLKPVFSQLAKVAMRGVIVTCRADGQEFDFISRFFAPGLGVNEDPVTGSAHCCLAPYWYEKMKKPELVAYQASERGGTVRMRFSGGERVQIGGRAVTVWKGDLDIP
jgi:predicted PhzF superfamily epimerase YddE/YHI9